MAGAVRGEAGGVAQQPFRIVELSTKFSSTFVSVALG